MYATSSQRRYFTFKNEEEIANLRVKHNQEFIAKQNYQLGLSVMRLRQQFRDRRKTNFVLILSFQSEECLQYFLTPAEEQKLLKMYELYLVDFCRRFVPEMPRCIVGTAFHYFKRFYVHNSPMDFHPKEIL